MRHYRIIKDWPIKSTGSTNRAFFIKQKTDSTKQGHQNPQKNKKNTEGL